MRKITNYIHSKHLTIALTIVATAFALPQIPTYADEMPRGQYTLTGVKVVPMERSAVNGKINDHQSDTLTHWVRFNIHSKFTLLDGTKTKPFRITNPTIRSKCSLTLDKPITFKGNKIPAGTNLLKYSKFDGSFYNVAMPNLSPLVIHSIWIRDDFKFPADTYKIKFQWQTNKGQTFSDTVNVRIDINAAKKPKQKSSLKAPTKPLEIRLGQAEMVFKGKVINKVISGEWVKAELLVQQPLINTVKGVKVKVTWRTKVGSFFIYDTAEGSEGVAILKDKHKGRYWLRADKFESPKKFAEIKRIITAEPADQPKSAAVETLTKNNTNFAVKLYHELSEEKDNLFFSPYSISSALAMTYAGANDQTANQMAEALHLTQDPADVHFAFGQLQDRYNKAGKKGNYKLSIANALWGQKDYNFLDDFLEITKENYGAGLNVLDFAKQTEISRKKINTWVEDKTNDKIKNLIPQGAIDPLTRLVLTNAIYFKGDWALQFDKKNTKKADFKVSPKKTVKADMMFMQDEFKFYQDKNVQVIELPYKGEDLSMMVILPKKAENLAEIEKQFNAKKLEKWNTSLRKQKTRLYLPKFKITWGTVTLNDVLEEMGMKDAFDANLADFSAMTGNKDLYITSVLHKAFVAVDEEGTEAAAATGVIMGLRSMPRLQTFRADHPFIFTIKDNKTNSILFMGRLCNPAITNK